MERLPSWTWTVDVGLRLRAYCPKSVGAALPTGERLSWVWMLNVGLRLRSADGERTVGEAVPKVGCKGSSLGDLRRSFEIRRGLRRPWGLRSLKPTGLLRPCDKDSEPVMLPLRLCDALKVPCLDNVVGVFWLTLPGLFDSGCGSIGLLGVCGLKPLSLAANMAFNVNGPWLLMGLRRSLGLRRVRKLCDLALRILGKDWLCL